MQDEEQWKHDWYDKGFKAGAEWAIENLESNPNPKVDWNKCTVQFWIEEKQKELRSKL